MYGNYIQFNLNVHRQKIENEKRKEKYTRENFDAVYFYSTSIQSLCTSSFSSSTTVNMSFDDDVALLNEYCVE